MPSVTSATPLIALDAVAVDTETTGLDAARARIVQIGGIGIAGGQLAGPRFETLVDPGEPIPPAVIAIHGIDDTRVRGAPAFPDAWTAFRSFSGGRVLVGHSIGFDLAVLERECARARLQWSKPRSLCVRLLATIAKPDLPDHSLDMIAAWLGVTVEGRHTALGDAAAAARVFSALLPKLLKRGIRTLGEAERAILSLSGELERGHQAGWTEPVSQPDAPPLRFIDPYAYCHRVGELMSSPPIVVRSRDTVRDVMSLMVERRISSVFVAEDPAPGQPVADYGIVTERDMMRRFTRDGPAAFDVTVGGFATRPLVSIREAAFAYRAIGRMDRLKIRHLAVRDDDGRLTGIVSARDLLRLRASSAIHLDDAIDQAGDAVVMAKAWSGLPAVVRSLVEEGVDARLVAEIVSEELCAVTRRASVLAVEAMQTEGQGAPPCPFTVLVLGSGGRGESLLAADQDNAVVFDAGEPGGPEDSWFATFGEKLAEFLHASGIPLCKGGVMARNAAFRGSLDLWKSRIDEWVRRSKPEDLLNVDIVFDMRSVHGEADLGAALFRHAYERGHAEPVFTKLLGEQVTAGNPFGLFGGLQLEDGRIDLKKHGLFPIVATARTLAIRHGIGERSTKDRVAGLIGKGLDPRGELAAMIADHGILLGLMLEQQSRDLFAGIPVSNRVELAPLSKARQAELKAILKRLQSAPDLVRDLMFV